MSQRLAAVQLPVHWWQCHLCDTTGKHATRRLALRGSHLHYMAEHYVEPLQPEHGTRLGRAFTYALAFVLAASLGFSTGGWCYWGRC